MQKNYWLLCTGDVSPLVPRMDSSLEPPRSLELTHSLEGDEWGGHWKEYHALGRGDSWVPGLPIQNRREGMLKYLSMSEPTSWKIRTSPHK